LLLKTKTMVTPASIMTTTKVRHMLKNNFYKINPYQHQFLKFFTTTFNFP
jgi:hypothetical protein